MASPLRVSITKDHPKYELFGPDLIVPAFPAALHTRVSKMLKGDCMLPYYGSISPSQYSTLVRYGTPEIHRDELWHLDQKVVEVRKYSPTMSSIEIFACDGRLHRMGKMNAAQNFIDHCLMTTARRKNSFSSFHSVVCTICSVQYDESRFSVISGRYLTKGRGETRGFTVGSICACVRPRSENGAKTYELFNNPVWIVLHWHKTGHLTARFISNSARDTLKKVRRSIKVHATNTTVLPFITVDGVDHDLTSTLKDQPLFEDILESHDDLTFGFATRGRTRPLPRAARLAWKDIGA
jgi:hypothetical protein